jgi:hypothetical protein
MNNGVNGYCFFVNPCMGEHKTWHQHKTAKVSRQTLLTRVAGNLKKNMQNAWMGRQPTLLTRVAWQLAT